MFEDILLENEQKELLLMLVEAARNLLRDQRGKFVVLRNGTSMVSIQHSGLPGGRLTNVYSGDIEVLDQEGLLVSSYHRDTRSFDVSPKGFKYYEQMKQHTGQPVQNIENTMRRYLNANHFQGKYATTYQKWSQAENLLWASDSEKQLTTIGHLCREALQEFATALVIQYQPPNINQNKASTVARIRAVLDLKKEQLGSTEKPFLEALLAYWGTLSDLVLRQEHGGKKEGQPLIWDDGRRVIFQTAAVMFEIDKSLS